MRATTPDFGPCTTPVLLLVFNRLPTVLAVLATLRQARPTRLYVAADGPRPGHPTDAPHCAAVRAAVLEGVDWPCQLITCFRDENLNCGLGPATAISWFFEHEPAGIILEDDCLPSPSFFGFCQEMLARYAHDTRVMHVGGNNFGPEGRRPQLPPGEEAYYFSRQVNSWGWATWRRAWQLFDYRLTSFELLRQQGRLRGVFGSRLEERYRLGKIGGVLKLAHPAHIWDYQWHFAIAINSGLCIVPSVNLVGNIGFGPEATHTSNAHDDLANIPAGELAWPLRHPALVLPDLPRDRRRFREFVRERLALRLLAALPWLRRPPARPAPAAAVLRQSQPVAGP